MAEDSASAAKISLSWALVPSSDHAVDKGAITIVAERNHDSWSPEQALNTVQDAIAKTNGNIQAILANNSGMARGAVQAIQAAGLGGKHESNVRHPEDEPGELLDQQDGHARFTDVLERGQ